MQKILVGERIKYLREINHYTREALAEKVDISSKFLYEIEMGKKGFSADTLSRLAVALSVSCDYILFGKSEDNRSIDYIVSVLNKFNSGQIGRLVGIIQEIYDLSVE